MPDKEGKISPEEAKAILDRAKQTLNANSDNLLAKFLGVSRQAISNARSSGNIPYRWLFEISHESAASLDYIIYGVGPKSNPPRATDKNVKHLFATHLVKEVINELGYKPNDQDIHALYKFIEEDLISRLKEKVADSLLMLKKREELNNIE